MTKGAWVLPATLAVCTFLILVLKVAEPSSHGWRFWLDMVIYSLGIYAWIMIALKSGDK